MSGRQHKTRMEESGEKKEINFITHDEQTKKKGQNYNLKDQIVLFNHRKEYNQKRLWENKSYLKWKMPKWERKALSSKSDKQNTGNSTAKPWNLLTSAPLTNDAKTKPSLGRFDELNW